MVLTDFMNKDNSPHQQLLNSIGPYCSTDGGLINSDKETLDFVINSMRTCDKHDLRIMFTKIIIHTDTKIMDVFLDSGAWKILSEWLQDARESKMLLVVKALVELCLKIPMNVLRLREGNCARTMRKLEKCPDESISKSAKTVVEKWRSIIDQAQSRSADSKVSQTSGGKTNSTKSGKNASTEANTKKSSKKSTEESQKKRKKCDSDTLSVDSTSDLKLKIRKVSRKATAALVGGVHADKKTDKVKQPAIITTSASSGVNSNNAIPTSQSLFRNVTTKVKQTKSRMDFLAENGTSKSSSTTTTTKSSNSNVVNKAKISELKTSDIISIKPKAVSKPISSLPKIPKVSSDDSKNVALSSNSEGTTLPPLFPPPGPKPVIKDSLSFMDAISKVPIIRRKTIRKDVVMSDLSDTTQAGAESKNKETKSDLTKNNNNNDGKIHDEEMTDVSNTTVNQTPKPIFNFYTDILKEKKEKEKALENERKQSDSKAITIDSQKINGLEIKDEQISPKLLANDSNNDKNNQNESQRKSPDNETIGLKGIILQGKSKQKFRVRFPPDDRLCQIEYFELDRTERTNVSRETPAMSCSQMKQYDMQLEADKLNEARKKKPWVLIEVDLDGFTNFAHLVGKCSELKEIEEERNKHSLEVFYMSSTIPDSPAEPDFEVVTDDNPPKIAPIELPNGTEIPILPIPGKEFPTYQPSTSSSSVYNVSVPNYTPDSISNLPIYNPVHQESNFTPANPQVLYNPTNRPHSFGMNDYSPAPPIAPQNIRPVSNDFNQYRNQTSPPQEPYNLNGPPNYWTEENFNNNPGPNVPVPPLPPVPPVQGRGYETFYNPRPPPPRFPGVRGAHDGAFHGPMGRPRDQIICKFYARFGNCKFREKCNYKHADPDRRF